MLKTREAKLVDYRHKKNRASFGSKRGPGVGVERKVGDGRTNTF
jgi:hypothetical protein